MTRSSPHGFVMGEDGQKMSKSLGNIVSPQDVVDAHGADILRLWVMESDTSEDIRIGPDIIKSQVDIYRRLRNTLRFIIGNLDGFDDGERLEAAHMPELERWVLNGLWRLDRRVRNAVDGFEFHGLFVELHHFCNNDLSAFYFDIRKDALYCNPMDSTRRRAARTVLDTLFDCLTAWFAPFLCFTAEEAWMTRHPGEEESVHLRQFLPRSGRVAGRGAGKEVGRDPRVAPGRDRRPWRWNGPPSGSGRACKPIPSSTPTPASATRWQTCRRPIPLT